MLVRGYLAEKIFQTLLKKSFRTTGLKKQIFKREIPVCRLLCLSAKSHWSSPYKNLKEKRNVEWKLWIKLLFFLITHFKVKHSVLAWIKLLYYLKQRCKNDISSLFLFSWNPTNNFPPSPARGKNHYLMSAMFGEAGNSSMNILKPLAPAAIY